MLLEKGAVRLSCKLLSKGTHSSANEETGCVQGEQSHQLWAQPAVASSPDLSKEAGNMDMLAMNLKSEILNKISHAHTAAG